MSQSLNGENSLDGLFSNYAELLQLMPNLVYILDKDGRFLQGNTNLMTLLGIEKASDLQTTLYNRLTECDRFSSTRAQVLQNHDITTMLGGEKQTDTAEPPVVDAAGAITYYQATRVPLKDKYSQTQGLLVVLTDISERKKLEQQLCQLKQLKPKPPSANGYFSSRPPGVIRNSDTEPYLLIIEDSPVALKASQALFLQANCRVDTALTGDAALNLFVPGKYDFVLMDIGLENNSGYAVAKEIRQKEKGSSYKVPIIALTGFSAKNVIADCLDYTMEGALEKPLTQLRVKEIIQRYILGNNITIKGLDSVDAQHSNSQPLR